ncbi:hypothetical protein J3486_28885 [Streptomyces sp. VRA16 Mangrove soil]|nr:hypothetical protein [Streptomyces sp. VRA16 Mangrove soil]
MILGAFLVGGVIAIWTGMHWAFDLRGLTTRRCVRIRQRRAETWDVTPDAANGLDASGNLLARPGYLRFLGAVMAVAGLLLILVTYALWELG